MNKKHSAANDSASPQTINPLPATLPAQTVQKLFNINVWLSLSGDHTIATGLLFFFSRKETILLIISQFFLFLHFTSLSIAIEISSQQSHLFHFYYLVFHSVCYKRIKYLQLRIALDSSYLKWKRHMRLLCYVAATFSLKMKRKTKRIFVVFGWFACFVHKCLPFSRSFPHATYKVCACGMDLLDGSRLITTKWTFRFTH